MSHRLYFALGAQLAWPARCLHCNCPDPDETVPLATGETVGVPSVVVVESRVSIDVPVCTSCRHDFRRNKALLWTLLLASILGLVLMGFVAGAYFHPAWTAPFFVAAFALAIWFKIYFARWYDGRFLGLQGGAVFQHQTFWVEPSSDELYEELDSLNQGGAP